MHLNFIGASGSLPPLGRRCGSPRWRLPIRRAAASCPSRGRSDGLRS